MASSEEIFDASDQIHKSIDRVGDLIEGDIFPKRTTAALESIAMFLDRIVQELAIANQLKAYKMAPSTVFHEEHRYQNIRRILTGEPVIN